MIHTKSIHRFHMGLSASKRVQKHLQASLEFNSACDSVYNHCLSLSQHAFSGVKPYQLYSATEQLHRTLSHSLPLISKWASHPPGRVQVDRAFKAVIYSRGSGSTPVQEEEIVLDEMEFKEFAVEVFSVAVVSNVEREVLKMVAVGVAGIGGIGVVINPGKGVLAAVIGAYALGAAADIYLSFAGTKRRNIKISEVRVTCQIFGQKESWQHNLQQPFKMDLV